MSIALIQSLPSGNAVQLILNLPAGTRAVRILRKATSDIAGFDDASARLVYEGRDRSFIDIAGLVNGTNYFYRAFYWNGTAWAGSPPRPVVPFCSFEDQSVDVQMLLRDRLDAGFAEYVRRGALKNKLGHIPVLTAAPMEGQVEMPMVTVHMVSDAPSDRAVGETLGLDEAEGEDVDSFEGWLSTVQITIVGWTTSSDVRSLLRRAIKAILIANNDVFDSRGLTRIEPNFTDQEDFESYQTPMYQATCTFTVQAPSVVALRARAIADVAASMSPTFP